MTGFELISIIIAVVAISVSTIAVFFSGAQTKRAAEALLQNQQLIIGNAVMHFTSRFFELIKDGLPFAQLENKEWMYQFWSLHATEFYFFHHGTLPTFMYTLWMIDLANCFSGDNGKKICDSHKSYLNTYSSNYPHMISFFNEIYQLTLSNEDENFRNRKISEFITSWIAKNKNIKLA